MEVQSYTEEYAEPRMMNLDYHSCELRLTEIYIIRKCAKQHSKTSKQFAHGRLQRKKTQLKIRSSH